MLIDIDFGLESTLRKSKKICEYTDNAKIAMDDFNLEKASSNIEQALYLCEQNMIALREVYSTININFPNKVRTVDYKSYQMLSMSIEKLNLEFDAYKITLPFLLPNQRSNWTLFKDSVGASFRFMIKKFCEENKVSYFQKSVVIIVTYYNELNQNSVCDNDNKEAKDIVNILSQYFISDDGGLICDIVYMSRLTDNKAHTDVYVSNCENFINLYQTIYHK